MTAKAPTDSPRLNSSAAVDSVPAGAADRSYAVDYLAIGAVCAFILIQLVWLSSIVLGAEAPFDTDEADHANAILELHRAVTTLSPSQILQAIVRQTFYPPLFSILALPVTLIGGISLATSRLASLLCYFGYLAFLSFAFVNFLSSKEFPADSRLRRLAPLLLVALAATSPITLENSVLSMLESCSLLSFAILLWVLSRLPEVPSWRQTVMLASVALLSLFAKYSFGIFVVPALCAALATTPGTSDAGRWRAIGRGAALGLIVLAVFALWMFATDPGSVRHFFVGHKSYAPMLSDENLLFDINAWLNSFCAHPSIACVTALFALYGTLRGWHFLIIRCAAWTFIVSAVLLTISTTNEERHFLLAAPALFFLAVTGFAAALERFAPRPRICAATIAATMLVLMPAVIRIEWFTARILAQFEGSPAFTTLQKFIVQHVDPREPILVNGARDDFSIEALRWLLARDGSLRYSEIRADSYPFRPDKMRTALKRHRNADYPALDRNFPRSPLQSVLARDYYRYAVQITDAQRFSRFQKEADEFRAATASLTGTVLTLDGLEVRVVPLPRRKH